MDFLTISTVSREFDVSTRTLRYYEQIGLLKSHKKDDYAYRIYDEAAVRRLRQILVLRKLRVPLKQIADILDDKDNTVTIGIFQKNMSEINSEITALTTIRDILLKFISHLNIKANVNFSIKILNDSELTGIIKSISLSKISYKEEQVMEDLNNTNEALNKLNGVRILHLPSCTVAASHYIGEAPELNSGNTLKRFISENDLYGIKPDARVFGFNHPNPSADRTAYGYEFWVTIPDDMEVAAPLQKKHFQGGLYAAHMIQMGNFHEWEWLCKWAENDNAKYTPNYRSEGEEIMGGCLEEHLNFVYDTHTLSHTWSEGQLDLLLPIKVMQ